jgi:hypothetical protein
MKISKNKNLTFFRLGLQFFGLDHTSVGCCDRSQIEANRKWSNGMLVRVISKKVGYFVLYFNNLNLFVIVLSMNGTTPLI